MSTGTAILRMLIAAACAAVVALGVAMFLTEIPEVWDGSMVPVSDLTWR